MKNLNKDDLLCIFTFLKMYRWTLTDDFDFSINDELVKSIDILTLKIRNIIFNN